MAQATPTKHCPGVESLGYPAHDLLADLVNFSRNASLRDGLAVRCRTCDGAYGKAWLAAKKAGQKFSAKGDLPAAVRGMLAGDRIAAAIADGLAEAVMPAPALTVVVGGLVPPTRYHDDLAVRAGRGKARGYTTELVGGVVYALPEDAGVLGSTEGQAALEAVNEARKAERRRRDAERKREERARAKAKEGATA